MFTQFAGLSLIIHLVIIGLAVVFNFVFKRGQRSAFQTYNKSGGVVKAKWVNSLISVAILVFVTSYMLLLGSVAVVTSLSVGATEPHVIFEKMVLHKIYEVIAFGVTTPLIAGPLFGSVLFFYLMRLVGRYQIQVRNIYLSSMQKLNTLFTSSPLMILFKQIDMFVDTIFRVVRSLFTFYTIDSYRMTPYKALTRVSLGVLIGIGILAMPILAGAAITEPGFESETVANGLVLPTAVAFAPDGRIFVAEKGGAIKVIKNDVLLPTPLVKLTDINTFGDRGLLGLAVDPDFANNGYIYVSYTYENTPGLDIAGTKTGRIVRLTVVGDTASESSKFVLVGSVGGSSGAASCEDYAVTADCIPSDSNSHSVGGLRFGPDGKLYATLGDGADFAAVDTRALRSQNIDSLAGKMLRINTDGTAPADNPFYNGDPNANRSKVYAFGFRNMFRFNFNEVTGKLYGGDVGWSDWEEINEIKAGQNYGWPCREGNGATDYGCNPTTTATNPLYTYPHNASGAGSITGGAFFTNNAYPSEYANSLFIGDYAQMWMKRLVLDNNGDLVSVENFNDLVWPVEILSGNDGNIYYLDIVLGSLNRLTHTDGNRRPVVSASGNPTSGLSPLNVSFSSAGTYDPDGDTLTYEWQFGDGATSNNANPNHTYNNDGSYLATLTVTDTFGATVSKNVDIISGNQAPQAIITSPASGALYRDGETVTVTGEGFDAEDGNLANSALEWKVILHHNVHTHEIYQQSGTDSIQFLTEDHGDPSVYLEIQLKVTDSVGLTSTQSINMYLNNGNGSGNLISNPSLEIEGGLNAPLDWYQSWYGVLNPVFTYPVNGLAGDRAAKVEVLSHETGNAKWYFSPVYVTPGETYLFSDVYISSVPTDVTVQMGRSDGAYNYVYLGTAPATNETTPFEKSFVVPEGIETLTVFHEIGEVGSLTVDGYSLTLVSDEDTTGPTGSITNINEGDVLSGEVLIEAEATDENGVTKVHIMVDGVKVEGPEATTTPYQLTLDTTKFSNGPHTLTLHMHDTADNHGLSDPINVVFQNATTTTGVNLIQNGDLEEVDGQNPAGWTANSWGTHTAVHTYPVAGRNGGVAAEVKITDYQFNDTGDSKWTHTGVPVTAGTEYLFEDWYTSTSISDIIGQYTMSDGTFSYFGLVKEIEPTAVWTKATNTFVPPPNAVSVKFFHLISSEATLVIDDVAMYVTGTGTPSETNVPIVEFVSPKAGDVLSGVVTLTASSTDDTAVAGVYFAVNGNPEGPEDTTSPYQTNWDTTLVPDGQYVLKATTHDVYGNNDKVEILVTVDNSNATTTPPNGTTTNLILNPDFEINGTGGNPANWKKGGWGTNNRVLTYPTAGQTGQGAKVAITSFTNGDAKWYFDEVDVEPNKEYTIGDSYKSNISSEALLRYTLVGGGTQYFFLEDLPSSNNAWTTFSKKFTTPANVESVTLFHTIAGVGEMTVDNYLLTDGTVATSTPDTTDPVVAVTTPNEGSTINGTVNVTVNATDNIAVAGVQLMIDGALFGNVDTTAPYTFVLDTTALSNGAHTIGARATDTAANTKDAVLVNVVVENSTTTPPTGNNLIINGDFETDDGTGNPANWKKGGWGTNNRNFSYISEIGGSHAFVSITGYVGGDAKWYFDDVSVLPNTEYTISDEYNSNIPSEALLRYTLTGGTTQYVFLESLPATGGTWNTFSKKFTTPANVESVTMFHIISANGNLSVDNYLLTDGTIATTTPDTTDPVVAITTPSDGTTVGGDVAIVANASDASGIQKIEFYIDGALSQTDTTAPYSMDWNAGSASDGNHTIYAKATDNAGNTADSDVITVEVDNSVPPPTDDNLIINGDLESGEANLPTGWNQGGSGNNDRNFTYPVAGENGNGAEVTISTYTNGDAKWYFDPVEVVAGNQYTFTYSYKSDATTNITLQYEMGDGSFTYVGIGDKSASPAWTNETLNIVPPTNAVKLTVFHALVEAGTLTIDNQVLVAGNANTLDRGKVSFSFDDGWLEHYTIAAPYLNSVGVDGTFYIVTDEMQAAQSAELITNGGLESGIGSPSDWNEGGWGTNDRVFTYPASGQSGDGAKVAITSFTDGDAKWYHDDVDVVAGASYEISEDYNSDIPSEVILRYLLDDDSTSYQFLASLPSTGGSWQQLDEVITVPVNAKALSVFHVIAAVGELTIDNLSINGGQTYANTDQVTAIRNAGHEIGSHTKSHPNLTTLNASDLYDEVVDSKTILEDTGLGPITGIAYPLGAYNETVRQSVALDGNYDYARSTERGYNDSISNPYALKIQQVDRDTTLGQMTTWIDIAAANKTWLILMFHQISDDLNADLGITEGDFENLVDYAVGSDIDIITVDEGVDEIKG